MCPFMPHFRFEVESCVSFLWSSDTSHLFCQHQASGTPKVLPRCIFSIFCTLSEELTLPSEVPPMSDGPYSDTNKPGVLKSLRLKVCFLGEHAHPRLPLNCSRFSCGLGDPCGKIVLAFADDKCHCKVFCRHAWQGHKASRELYRAS